MKFEELAAKRRSVRKFTDKKIDRDLIDKIIEITLTAPSSKNSRTTRLVYTDDKKILETVSTMRSSGSAFVKDAPGAFFVMGDDAQTDLWRENAAISATVLQFAAESLGLASCWVHVNGRPHSQDDPGGKTAREYLRDSIAGFPDYRILCVVAVGYPDIAHKPHELKVDPERVTYL